MPRWSLLILGVFALMLTACDDLSSEDYIERARNHREQGDIQASIIQLKNAVQADRNNAEARLLLGRSYLDVGQLKNAEKEFLRSRTLGIDQETAIEALAAVWLMLREPGRVLEEFAIDDDAPPEQRVMLHLVRATAHYDLGDFSSADQEYRKALQIDPDNLQALIGSTSLALGQGRLSDARSMLASMRRLADDDANVFVLTGDLSLRQGDLEAAEQAYRSLLEVRPRNVAASLALAQVELMMGKVDSGLASIEQVLQRLPTHVGANYLRAAVAAKTGDFVAAKRHSERVLQANPKHRESLLVAGAANLALDELEQAHQFLRLFVAQSPGHETGARLLATVKARLARRERYPPEVTNLLDGTADDRMLVAVGDPAEQWQQTLEIGGELWRTLESNLRQVDTEQPCATAEDLETFLSEFEGSSRRLPWLPGFPENDCTAEMRARLEDLREQQPYSFVREVFLVQLGLRDGRLRATLRAAENLRLEDAERPSLLVLKGLADLGLGRMTLARATFRSLREVVPSSAAAQLLVAMTYGDDERQTQTAQLEEALSIDPGHFATRIELARLAAESGDFADAERHIGQLIQTAPEDPSVVELQALLALVRGDHADAVSYLGRALDIAPNGVRALKLAIAYDRLGNAAEAAASLEGWLSIRPTDMEVRLALANRYLSSGQVEEARSQYRKVRLLAPNNFVALNNLAWTEVLLGNPRVALTPAQQAYRLAPDDPRVLDTYGYALAESGDLDKAVELLRRAVKRSPRDAQAQYHLAHALTKRGDREEAKGILERILADPTIFRGRENAKALLQQLQG